MWQKPKDFRMFDNGGEPWTNRLRLPFWLAISLLVHGGGLLLHFPREPLPAAPPPLEITVRVLPNALLSAPNAPPPPRAKIPAAADRHPLLPPPPAPQRQEAALAKPVPIPAAHFSEQSVPQKFSGEVAPASAEEMPSPPPAIRETFPSTPQTVAEAVPLIEAVPAAGDNRPPAYPRLAQQRGWQGVVILRVQVDAGGDVEALRLEQSSGYDILDSAALAAVRRWRFQPARVGDEAVAGEVRVPIVFELRGG
jgi:periplasmic protein TonB